MATIEEKFFYKPNTFFSKDDMTPLTTCNDTNDLRSRLKDYLDGNKDALMGIFIWGRTMEGYAYWRDVYNGEIETTDEVVENIKNKVTTFLIIN